MKKKKPLGAGRHNGKEKRTAVRGEKAAGGHTQATAPAAAAYNCERKFNHIFKVQLSRGARRKIVRHFPFGKALHVRFVQGSNLKNNK